MKKPEQASNVVYMLIDTCVWLDLARQADSAKLVTMLRELTDQGRLALLVPDIVIEEFERNRDKVQATMTRSISSRFREVRKAIEEHGREIDKDKVLRELDDITHQVPIVTELATQTFDAILELLHKGDRLEATTQMKEHAVERALAKRAPFHREKNSVADALIIELYGDAVRKAGKSDLYCFITHNVKDFSSTDADDRDPHTDIASYFNGATSRYFINLQTALTAYLPNEVEELDFELEYFDDPRPLSEVLPYLNKLHDQIWYNRHKNREYHIQTGEIKIVERWKKENAHSTIARDIWEGAQKAARQVEAEYGPDELGPWDDFEWGVLNGKMSAIRWMLGEDWESTLDT